MFGFIALISTTAGILALYLLRFGVLDRFSLPQHLAALLAIVLGGIELKRGGSRAGSVCAILAITGALLFSGSLEYFTRYSKDRPSGPSVGESIAELDLVDALTHEPILLADEHAPPLTMLSCFRGFW